MITADELNRDFCNALLIATRSYADGNASPEEIIAAWTGLTADIFEKVEIGIDGLAKMMTQVNPDLKDSCKNALLILLGVYIAQNRDKIAGEAK
jgi:hypothetical protein